MLWVWVCGVVDGLRTLKPLRNRNYSQYNVFFRPFQEPCHEVVGIASRSLKRWEFRETHFEGYGGNSTRSNSQV